MEILNQYLSPLDDIEYICDTHGIPCIGVCGSSSCKEKSKFLCIKCIKAGDTCITKQKHELVTLSEMIYRFFLKMENKSLDLLQIQTMEKIIQKLNEEDFNNILSNYKTVQSMNIKKYEEIKKLFSDIVTDLIQTFKNNNISELNDIKFKLKNQTDNNDIQDINLIFNMKLPNNLSIKKKENIIQFINETYKNTPAKDLVNQAKLFSNTHKVSKLSRLFNGKITINETTSLNDEKKKNLEEKIDSILNEFESKFDEELSKIGQKFILPKENMSIYTYYNLTNKFINDPNELVFKQDICSNSHKTNSIDRVFCAFKSFNGEPLVVWGSTSLNIEFYDCNKDKIVKTIFQAHKQTIFSCRHYPDVRLRKDYIITSSNDRSVKVWDITKDNYDLYISNVHNGYYIYSVSLLCHIHKETNYIITSCPNEKMKVWDFSGAYLRNFGQSNESTYFIDIFYNKIQKKYFVINANSNDVKSYHFETGDLYQKYKGTPQTWHMSAVVNDVNDIFVLIESDGNGTIRIWNFDTAELLKSINSTNSINLRGICLWNDRYLFAAGNDSQVKLFDLEEGKFVKTFTGHTSTVCTLEKIMHPKYGGCLISHALDGKLKIWAPAQQ
jgi:hypothetical protein